MIAIHDIGVALRKRYPANAWFLGFEVRNSPGFPKEQTSADAIAMSLWPSHGFVIHGFEIKRTRADWMNELKKPRKSEVIREKCDFWWLLATTNVAEPSEIPETWGYIRCSANGALRIVKDAPRNEARGSEIDRAFVASMLKNTLNLSEEDIRQRVSREVRKQLEYQLKYKQRSHDEALQRMQEKYDRDLKWFAEFKEEAEHMVTFWSDPRTEARRIGSAIQLREAMRGDIPQIKTRASKILKNIEKLEESIGEDLK